MNNAIDEAEVDVVVVGAGLAAARRLARAARVIVAVPPPSAGRIAYDPPLPGVPNLAIAAATYIRHPDGSNRTSIEAPLRGGC